LLPLAATGAAIAASLLLRRRLRSWYEADFERRRPLGANGIVRGAEPIELHASRTHAVLLLHGFNDTPQSVSYLAHALHAKGWSVRAPLLPGHGRGLEAACSGRAETWLAFARAQYEEMSATYSVVVLGGQSMGGALAALVAAKHPSIPALVLMAPYLGMPRGLQLKLAGAWIAHAFTPYHANTGGERSIHDPEARARALGTGVVTAGMLVQLRRIAAKAARDLPKIMVPTLYIQSREDNRIDEGDARRFFSLIGCADKVQRWLTGCGHIIAEDYCRDEVVHEMEAWIIGRAGEPTVDGVRHG
jgi:carboxylesterase